MLNFVYLRKSDNEFFGIEETKWVNLPEYMNLQCRDTINKAFLNNTSIYSAFPDLKNAGQNVNRFLGSFNVDYRIDFLVYYCDNNGLDDVYFSNLVFKNGTSSDNILKCCTLSQLFGIDIQRIKEKIDDSKKKEMNLFILTRKYDCHEILNFQGLKLKAIKCVYHNEGSKGCIPTYYNLSKNQLEYFNSKTIETDRDKGIDLLTINLSSNIIESIQLSTFNKFDALQNIYLSHNRLETLSINLNSLKKLKKLNLSNNKLTKITFEESSGGVLEKLSLQYNELIDDDDSQTIWTQIQKLTNLKELYLNGNKLKCIEKIQIKETTKRLLGLEFFHLYDNLFSESDLKKLKEIFSWDKIKKPIINLNDIKNRFVKGNEITDERLSEILASTHWSVYFVMDKISSNLKGIIKF